MIHIENTEVSGFKAAIRGMRNPMNSWDRSDSYVCTEYTCNQCDCQQVMNGTEPFGNCHDGEIGFCVGVNDHDLMRRLAHAGTEHAKYLRYINVTCDITAPLYWYKEMDTYRVGVEHNSCSTMHKIQDKEFTLDDFSVDKLGFASMDVMRVVIAALNGYRSNYNEYHDKFAWLQMIQLLPSSYNQRRTYQFSYQALAAIYRQRKGHKLDEWKEFRKWIEKLPYSELITLKEEDE